MFQQDRGNVAPPVKIVARPRRDSNTKPSPPEAGLRIAQGSTGLGVRATLDCRGASSGVVTTGTSWHLRVNLPEAAESVLAGQLDGLRLSQLHAAGTYHVLFFIHLPTRRVQIAGMTPNSDDLWMAQAARNMSMALTSYFPALAGPELEQPAKALLDAGIGDVCGPVAREGLGQGNQRLRDGRSGALSISGTPLLRASIIVR